MDADFGPFFLSFWSCFPVCNTVDFEKKNAGMEITFLRVQTFEFVS